MPDNIFTRIVRVLWALCGFCKRQLLVGGTTAIILINNKSSILNGWFCLLTHTTIVICRRFARKRTRIIMLAFDTFVICLNLYVVLLDDNRLKPSVGLFYVEYNWQNWRTVRRIYGLRISTKINLHRNCVLLLNIQFSILNDRMVIKLITNLYNII